MSVSLDGYVETQDHKIDWVLVDEELHTFFNDQARETGAFLFGRRMYELMANYWPTADTNPQAHAVEVDFAHIWKNMPKVVFSKTLEKVEWNSRLVKENAGDQITKLKEQPGKDLSIGGPNLASSIMQLGLIDEYQLFVNPVLLGEGTPFFPTLQKPINLQLMETRTFGSGVVYLRYETNGKER
jgi:dihydrofolate reductase